MTSGLVDLLEKDSTNADPARVINISSVAGIEAESEGSLSDAGNGVWSCKSYPIFNRLRSLIFRSDNTSKAAGKRIKNTV